MTDVEQGEQEPVDFHRIHVVKAAAWPLHTLIGAAIERTGRCTLRVVVAGHAPGQGVLHFFSNQGRAFSYLDTLYYDN